MQAQTYNNIGSVYNNFEKRKKALKYTQMALKIQVEILGKDHPDMALSYNNIGCVYYSLEDYGEALHYNRKALKIQLEVLGENHPSVAFSYNNIGLVYYTLEDYNQAFDNHLKAFFVLSKSYTQPCPPILETLTSLIDCSKNMSPPQIVALRDVYNVSVKILGHQHQLNQKLSLNL